MTRINLLPPEKIKVKRAGERNYLWLALILPVVVAVIIGVWYFSVSGDVNKKEEALQAAKEELATWQAKNQQLEKYRTRQEEISQIEDVAVTALQGRVYWARILNNISLMCPTDIWLTSLTGNSEAETGGTVDFQGYALQCPNRDYCGYGIYPHYPDYRPIAGWLDRMAQIAEFESIWLSNATPFFHGAVCTTEGVEVVKPLTGTQWYEDPYCTGKCSGQATSSGQYTCFVGDWLIEFTSQARLDMETAVIGGTATSEAAEPTDTSTEQPAESETTGEESGGEQQ